MVKTKKFKDSILGRNQMKGWIEYMQSKGYEVVSINLDRRHLAGSTPWKPWHHVTMQLVNNLKEGSIKVNSNPSLFDLNIVIKFFITPILLLNIYNKTDYARNNNLTWASFTGDIEYGAVLLTYGMITFVLFFYVITKLF